MFCSQDPVLEISAPTQNSVKSRWRNARIE